MGLAILTDTEISIRVFKNREALTKSASEYVVEKLRAALQIKGSARMALSGGSTPKPLYEALSDQYLDWPKITAALVDERLEADAIGSNLEMIKNTLAQDRAANIAFEGFTDTANRQDADFDLCLMGMGTDGHTASWFPGAEGLEEALDVSGTQSVVQISAQGCPGAGNYPKRITLSLPTVMESRAILLLITGDEKRRVFETAVTASVYDAPVKALLAAGNRLTVMWAP